jgi:hypothetical protein
MSDHRMPALTAASGDEVHQALRQLGSRAHQLRAATRAADHFNARDNSEDRNTGSWLMSCALALSADLAVDIDGLARSLKEHPVDAALQARVSGLRVRTHQLHAAARAADHFLDQDTREDRDTGTWLIATASSLAQKLACELDDNAVPARRQALDKTAIEPHDAGLARRVAAATAPVYGSAA